MDTLLKQMSKLLKQIGEWGKTLQTKAKAIKSHLQLLAIAYQDKQTPLVAKLLIGFTIGYMLSPIDLIPDFIPVLGLVDELILIPLLISFSIRLIPKPVLEKAREKLRSQPYLVRKNAWWFALLIIIFWLCIGAYIVRKFFP